MINRNPPEVRSRLIELKRQMASAIVDEQRLYQRYFEANREAEKWRGRAELALRHDSEELARAALERAGNSSNRAAEYHRQYLDQKGHVEWMKTRLLSAGSRAPLPVAPLTPADIARLERNLDRLERWETRDSEERARLAAWAELERDEVAEKLAALERESQVEQQLSELKQKLGMAGAEG